MASPAEDLGVLGVIKEPVMVLGKKIIMQTLDSDLEASARAASAIFDEKTRDLVEKIEKLARAIETIDGVPFVVTPEEAAKGMTALQKARLGIYHWQPIVVERVYSEYEKLLKKRDAAIAEIEKKRSVPDYIFYRWKVIGALGLTLSEFERLADWEKRIHIACAVAEDDRNRDVIRESLKFMASIWCGPADDVTPDNPVSESTTRSGRTETRVKKVLNVRYDEEVERLRKSSIGIAADGKAVLNKVMSQIAEERKHRVDNG